MTWTRITLPAASSDPDGPRLRYLLLVESPDAPVVAEVHRMWQEGTRTWPVVVSRHSPATWWSVDSPTPLGVVLATLDYLPVSGDDLAWLTAPDLV